MPLTVSLCIQKLYYCPARTAEVPKVSEKAIRIGIIGGGASGLFTACRLKKLAGTKDIEVTVLERNSIPGKKLTLTGHGRCNITNRKEASDLKNCYHEAGNFLYPALKESGPEETVSFMEKDLGMKLKEEDNNRMFPVCDSAVAVRDAIVSYLKDSTKIVCDAKVTAINKNSEFEVETSKGRFCFDYVVLACGGSSFPKTGSDGDSYKFAGDLGHTIIPIRGALAPVKADSASAAFTSALSGVSMNAKVSLFVSDKVTASVRGEVLFAEFGLTGPAVMEISREIPADIRGEGVLLELDLIPSMSDEQFDSELLDSIGRHADTKITTLISRYIPASVALEVAKRAGVSDLYAQGFTKDNRKNLCREIKHLKIGIADKPDLDKAYVTRGGVSLKEVDRKTMKSKLVEGLYIVGEALDVDGISGGFNLQACMSEGYLAAKDILK